MASLGRGSGCKQGEAAAAGHSCAHCGTVFPSRTKLFKHLRGDGPGGEDCMAKARDAGMAVPKRTIRAPACVHV
jgi:hypothetical protein|eukprot:COSAG02_NODE_406_length_22916_cov_35.137529_8_plen_74_part_00